MIVAEKDIETLVRDDPWMMHVLRAAEILNLPDWWIGASFLRNKVWDAIEGNPFIVSRDVDLVYFDSSSIQPETDWAYDERMLKNLPFAEWEVRNQARMHYKNGSKPYTSTEDAISRWVETATCVAVRVEADVLQFLYLHGSNDLLDLVARPVAEFQSPEMIKIFYDRIQQKKWRERWPHLRVIES